MLVILLLLLQTNPHSYFELLCVAGAFYILSLCARRPPSRNQINVPFQLHRLQNLQVIKVI